MNHPAPHARIVVTGEDVVVLDTRANRYLGLPAAALTRPVESRSTSDLRCLHPDAAKALLEAGLLVDGAGEPPTALDHPAALPGRRAPATMRPRIVDAVDLVLCLAIVGLRLLRDRPFRQHLTARSTVGSGISEDVLRRRLAALDRLRLIIPTPRRCLPSALTTCLWLGRKGIATEVVFGVRTHPFEAHCWAECGGLALDDDPERLRGFTPIAVATA